LCLLHYSPAVEDRQNPPPTSSLLPHTAITTPVSDLKILNGCRWEDCGLDRADFANGLERLGQLMEKGYISKEEFAIKKSELFNRI
jgi:hypothetical protein